MNGFGMNLQTLIAARTSAATATTNATAGLS
jgi:hypothetical protein